jgi:hypothetical protein
MRRWSKCLAGIATATGLLLTVVPAAGAAGVPDASCDANLGASIVQPNGDQKVAQTFTALHTGALDTASTAVTTPMSPTPGDWRLEIASTTGGAPGAVLASTTVPNTLAANTQSTITGTFANPAAVSAGAEFALLISRPGSNGYAVAEEGGDPCPGQGYFQNAPSGPFLIDNFVDFRFATTVQLPTPTGPGTGGGTGAAKKKCKKHKRKHHSAESAKKKKCKKKKKGKR